MPNQTIGEFLQVLRKDKGLTQQEVADKLNVSNRTLSSWETDRTAPDLLLLPSIADLYDVTVDELLRGERKTDAPKHDEAVQVSSVKEQPFEGFLSKLKKLTALSLLCAAAVVVALALLLFVPSPIWVDSAILAFGGAGNIVIVALIFRSQGKALSDVPQEEKGTILAVKHKSSFALILNSLAYIAGLIVILLCLFFVRYPNFNPTGNVYEYYEAYAAVSLFILFILGGALMLCGVISNLANINCLGLERQKITVKINVALFKKIGVCGIAVIVACLIPLAVFNHITFTETEDYLTVEGVDEVYKTFQTLEINSDYALTSKDNEGNVQLTVIPKGEYYLDFKTEEYVETSNAWYEISISGITTMFHLGNNFYSDFNYDRIEGMNEGATISVYYLKDGVNVEDISRDKPYTDYFIFIKNYPIVKFYSPDDEPLVAVRIPYYLKRDNGYYDDEGWRYDYDELYNLRDELVLNRNGNQYTYSLITYRNYTPLATYCFCGATFLTVCVCGVIQLLKRKKIDYEF